MMRNGFLILITCLWGMGGFAALEAEESHPFGIRDLVMLDRLSGLVVSPDGQTLVFVIRKTDMEANRGRTDLWCCDREGKEVRQLTSHPAADFNPCWAPDGKSVYFLSTRSGSSQVWRLPLTGDEAVQVTDQPLDVENLVISPDGNYLGFTMRVFPECETVEATVKKLEAIEARKATGMLYDKLFVRHWDTWKDGRRSHVFIYSLDGTFFKDMMQGMDADAPSQPFGGAEEISFTPNSKAILFVTRLAGREEAWSTNFDLMFAGIEGLSPNLNFTKDFPAWDTGPVFSHDGHQLAFLSMTEPGYESDRFKILLRGFPYGGLREVATDWDRSPHSLFFSPDDKKLFAVADNLGQRSLFSINLENGEVRTVIRDGHVRFPAFAGHRIVFGMDTLDSPVSLYSCNSDGSDVKLLFDPNAEKKKTYRTGEFEQFTFKGWNAETVYGYVVKPVDFDETKKYPIAFLIHGGPQGSFGNDFHYRWNPQNWAGAGYAVVMIDFHGSTGYGQAFTDSIQSDWGGKPFEDLQKGLAAAIERYPWLDGERVGAAGASFGGYMINWVAGNWPDRFRCLVNHDGNLDERFAYYDTEELWFPERDHGGVPWENPEGYEKHNPINFVQNWKTPMLVIHGAKDYRVVDTQGLATFNVLQRRGVPSKLLYYPDENHWVLKPHNSIQWYDTVLDWFDTYCKKD